MTPIILTFIRLWWEECILSELALFDFLTEWISVISTQRL